MGFQDKVAFTIEDGEVGLKSAAFSLESAFGSVTPSSRPEDFDRLGGDRKEATAQKTVREMRQE